MTSTAKSLTAGGDNQGSVSEAIDGARDAVHRRIETISEAAHPVVEDIASVAHNAVERVGAGASRAAQAVAARGEQLRAGHARFTEQCRDQVREKPFTSVGVAVAVGVIAGWLWSNQR